MPVYLLGMPVYLFYLEPFSFHTFFLDTSTHFDKLSGVGSLQEKTSQSHLAVTRHILF